MNRKDFLTNSGLFLGSVLLSRHLRAMQLASAPFPSGLTRDMVLWYTQPGQNWLEGLPIGNGYMGAMVFGGLRQERIALNESTFWSGRPHDYDDPNASQYFPQIRDLVFAEKFQEAERMADDHFYGKPKAQEAYQPIGDLLDRFRVIDQRTVHVQAFFDQRLNLIRHRSICSNREYPSGVPISTNVPSSVMPRRILPLARIAGNVSCSIETWRPAGMKSITAGSSIYAPALINPGA